MNIIDTLQYSFIQRAIITGSFVAILCSILGLFLVLRHLSLIGDGLSHVSFGAIAIGLFFGFYPTFLAVPIVVLASLFVLKITEKTRVYGDAAIGIISSIGIASGIILSSVSGGFNVDLFSYLFGNILSISQTEMFSSIILSLIVIAIIVFYYYDLFSVTFSAELAKVTGVKTDFISTLLVVLTAITVVLSIRVVGIMLVSALLILPAITALQVSRGFKRAIFLSAFIGVFSVVIGTFTSLIFNFPAGATIVLVSFGFFLLSLLKVKLLK